MDLSASALEVCRRNVTDHKLNSRVLCIQADATSSPPLGIGSFDLIVSNPPYFVNALKCPDEQRSLARHGGGLNYISLFRHSRELLAGEGKVSIIVPSEMTGLAEDAAWAHELYPERRTRIYTKERKPSRRVLITFGLKLCPLQEDAIYIHTPDGSYTQEYKELTRDFYLNF